MSKRIELGMDHWMQWFVPFDGPEEYIGVIVWHPAKPEDTRCIENHDGWCGGAIHFNVPQNANILKADGTPRPKWNVESLDPLSLNPSLGCHCGDHGFIKQGRWAINA